MKNGKQQIGIMVKISLFLGLLCTMSAQAGHRYGSSQVIGSSPSFGFKTPNVLSTPWHGGKNAIFDSLSGVKEQISNAYGSVQHFAYEHPVKAGALVGLGALGLGSFFARKKIISLFTVPELYSAINQSTVWHGQNGDKIAIKAEEKLKQQKKLEADRKAKEEADRKQAQEEADRKAKEEADRKAKEEADRKAKEEADRKQAQEEADRKAKEEADRKAKEEADRKAKEEADRKQAQEEAEIVIQQRSIDKKAHSFETTGNFAKQYGCLSKTKKDIVISINNIRELGKHTERTSQKKERPLIFLNQAPKCLQVFVGSIEKQLNKMTKAHTFTLTEAQREGFEIVETEDDFAYTDDPDRSPIAIKRTELTQLLKQADRETQLWFIKNKGLLEAYIKHIKNTVLLCDDAMMRIKNTGKKFLSFYDQVANSFDHLKKVGITDIDSIYIDYLEFNSVNEGIAQSSSDIQKKIKDICKKKDIDYNTELGKKYRQIEATLCYEWAKKLYDAYIYDNSHSDEKPTVNPLGISPEEAKRYNLTSEEVAKLHLACGYIGEVLSAIRELEKKPLSLKNRNSLVW